MRGLLLWGATGQARVLAEFAPDLGFRIAAFMDLDPAIASPIVGVPIAHDLDTMDRLIAEEGVEAGAPAVGGWRGAVRLEILSLMSQRGLATPRLVHPAAWVAKDAFVAEGAQIMAGACVASGASIAAGTMLNTRSSVDHETEVEAGVHVAPGAVVAGCALLGARAFIGPGAAVGARVRIGADAIVGAGSVVIRDIPEKVLAVGAPARVIRPLE